MAPAQPPLPTAWNFPFQSAAGSQTSILMSESVDGVSVAATRQKAGRRLNCGTAAALAPGSVNPPAGTICARVIEVFGSAIDDNRSHGAGALNPWPYTIIPTKTAHDPAVAILIRYGVVVTAVHAGGLPTAPAGNRASTGTCPSRRASAGTTFRRRARD